MKTNRKCELSAEQQQPYNFKSSQTDKYAQIRPIDAVVTRNHVLLIRINNRNDIWSDSAL